MAGIYEQYQKNRAKGLVTNRSLEERVDAAMDQTELLRGVRERVAQFVAAYEDTYAPEIRDLAEMKQAASLTPFQANMLANMERDLQEVVQVGRSPEGKPFTLTLDDIKILLDQFPQKS